MSPIRDNLKQGYVLWPLLFNLKRNCFKVNSTHQLLVFADDVNILGGSVYTVEKKAEILVVLVRNLD